MTITKNHITGQNRPKTKRKKTTKIAVHYVGNAGSTAVANRNFFQNTKTKVSSNYIVGLDGEVICCIPDEEVAWCTNEANSYSVSIETCHPKTDGKFNAKTYKSLVELCAHLCEKYKLTSDDLIRHYDVTKKVCPKCFVAKSKGGTDDENLTAWKKFKSDVKAEMKKSASSSPSAPKAPKFTIGKVYTTTHKRGLYKGCGSVTGRKKVRDLTTDGKKNTTTSLSSADAYFKAGTKITLKEVKASAGGNLWGRCPSGWLCIWEKDKDKKFLK